MNIALRLLKSINWRVVTAALFGVGILHIIATLAAPSLAIATAFDRLEPVLVRNRMVVLPEVVPGGQPLPFMSPSLRYAMCRFDTARHAIEVVADLKDPGSSLAIYAPHGETIYASVAAAEVPRQRIRLVPPDDRFLGLTPEARGVASKQPATATLPATTGIAIVAVPERGPAFRGETTRQLETARCGEITELR